MSFSQSTIQKKEQQIVIYVKCLFINKKMYQ